MSQSLKNLSSNSLPRSQKGVVLAASLIFLIVVTLIATSGMETTILEERMAGNMQDYNLAFQAAETSLEVGERWLENQIYLPSTSDNGTTIVWIPDGPADIADTSNWWEERLESWWSTNAEAATGLSEVAQQPLYIIEQHFSTFQGQSLTIGTGDSSASRVLHRITGRGVGGNQNAQVMLQTTYIRPYD